MVSAHTVSWEKKYISVLQGWGVTQESGQWRATHLEANPCPYEAVGSTWVIRNYNNTNGIAPKFKWVSPEEPYTCTYLLLQRSLNGIFSRKSRLRDQEIPKRHLQGPQEI